MSTFRNNINKNLSSEGLSILNSGCFGPSGAYDNIVFNDNGYVTGYNSITGTLPANLSPECCLELGMRYENGISKCLWVPRCTPEEDFKIILNPQGNDGAIFQVEEGEECTLKVDFDWLFMFNCEHFITPLKGDTTQCEQDVAELQAQLDTCTANTQTQRQIIRDNEKKISSLKARVTTEKDKDLARDLGRQLTLDLIRQDKLKSNVNDCEEQFTNLYTGTAACQMVGNCIDPESDEWDRYIKCRATAGRIAWRLFNCQQELADLVANGAPQQDIDDKEIECNNFQSQLDAVNNDQNCQLPSSQCGLPEPLRCLNNFEVCMTVEKVIPQSVSGLTIPANTNIIIESPLTVETVLEDQLIDINDIASYLDGNTHTGLLISGGTRQCVADAIKNIQDSLIENGQGDVLSADSFTSDWKHHTLEITDPTILSGLTNEKLKFGLKVKDCQCDFSILLDNIEINKLCTLTSTTEGTETIIRRAPGFKLKRVQDNKKSWVNSVEPENRKFDLELRETNYDVNNHRLVINSKEIDLGVDPASSIASDVLTYVKDNPCLLTGMTSGDTNISELITTPLSSVTTVEEFELLLIQELIDVKSRLVLNDYPTLRLLYDRYIDPITNGCVVGSKQFNYRTLHSFASLLGTYWVDLLEQLVPATSIWGSTYRYRNTVFDTEKFKYKRYNLITCAQGSVYKDAISVQLTGNTDVEVVLTEIMDNEPGTTSDGKVIGGLVPNPEGPGSIKFADKGGIPDITCNGVLITKISDASEFTGTVTVQGLRRKTGSNNNATHIGEA